MFPHRHSPSRPVPTPAAVLVPAELTPHRVELFRERRAQLCIFYDDDVLLVTEHSLPGPVEAPVDELGAVDHGELVVHVRGGRVGSYRDPGLSDGA